MLTLLPFAAAPMASAALPACAPMQLSLATDDENGAFDGMSHSGTLLVLRNQGTKACRLPGLPPVAFRDAEGKRLPIVRAVPPGMHPGPVVLPVGVAAGAEATAGLRWVSGEVYDKGRCFDARSLAVTIGGTALKVSFAAHICGPAKGATFEQPPLRTDPVLAP